VVELHADGHQGPPYWSFHVGRTFGAHACAHGTNGEKSSGVVESSNIWRDQGV